MIVFNNWTLTVTGLIARQYDNLSRRIDVEGDLPAGYTWQLLVQSGGNADTILLEATETGAGALLTADNLSRAGEYYIQLRGTLEADGTTKRHTNVVSCFVPESLTGLGTWPEVPTEFAQVEARILELYQHPPVPGSNGYWLVWDTDKDEYMESQLALPEAAAGGTSDHSKLANRDAAYQHPMSAITGLEQALAGKQPTGDYLTEEQDPTVPEWAKHPQKPAYTAQEVGALPATTHIPSTAADVNAEPSGAVSQHNVSDAAHSDIRLLIQGMSERLSAVADSDDTTLDQLSEIVAYIKSNKSLIDAITTSKVNVADIVDNLTTNVANKPLSAAQGVALKALIDTITVPDKLPNPNALTFTGAVTGSYDGSEAVTVEIANLQTSGLTTAQVNALDGMFKVCAFIKDDISAEYNAFCTAFGIEAATITEISATYSGGAVAVGTAVTDLTGIVVTANYSDGSKRTVTGYTLSGTIAEGSNTITVTYDGMTTTFTVTGVAEEVTITSISATYDGGDVAVGTAVADLTGLVVTAHYSDGTSQTVTGYTLSGTIAEGSNTVTVTYQGKTATFTVTGVAGSGGGDEPVDTTAKIAGTGYGLNGQGELQPKEKACYTEFYSFGRTIEGSDSRKVIYYVSTGNQGGMASADKQTVYQDGEFVTYWTTKFDSVNENNFSGNYGPFNQLRFSLVTAYIDDDYAYFADTGEVIFAGKNTPYYGMANIDGTMAVKV